jgi:hypothetical protein
VRLLALLPTALVTACLTQNPGFDPGTTSTAGSTMAGDTTEPGATTHLTDTDAAEATTSGTGGETLGGTTTSTTATTGDPTTGSVTADPATTGCALEPLFPDADDDGFGAGEMVLACPDDPGFAGVDGDCDDANDAVNPAAMELCNQVDDDCDTLLDEFSPANGDCEDCTLGEFAGHSYWFCDEIDDWDNARSHCQAFGPVDMPIVDDADENAFIFAGNRLPESPMWVGGRDSDPIMNAHYTWYDGSPLTYKNFALADLDNGCISMPAGDGGMWRDRDCEFEYAIACESKP